MIIMKAKFIFIFILLALFGGLLLIKFLVLEQDNIYGKIRVLSSPAASVFINNVVVGKTPYENKYKAGEYLIKLIPEGEGVDAASWQGKIKVNKNALTYVNRELGSSDLASAGEIFTVSRMERKPNKPETGEVFVETEPSGAIVSLNNDEKGISPLALSDVPRGDHEISVFMPGFFRRNQKINVDTGYRVSAVYKLATDQTQQKELSKNNKEEASPSASLDKKKANVVIQDTPTGWLRVREEPSISASEAAKVNPGGKYELIEEKQGWYKIFYSEGKAGWVSSQYAKKEE